MRRAHILLKMIKSGCQFQQLIANIPTALAFVVSLAGVSEIHLFLFSKDEVSA